MRRQPGPCRTLHTTELLGVDHLDGLAEASPRLRLDLHEPDRATTTHDDVDLVPTGPRIRGEDPVAAQSVPPDGATLGSVHATKLARELRQAGAGSASSLAARTA